MVQAERLRATGRRAPLLLLLATLVPTGVYIAYDTLQLASLSPFVALAAFTLVGAAGLVLAGLVRGFGPSLGPWPVLAALAWGALAAPAFALEANAAWSSVMGSVVAGEGGPLFGFPVVAGPIEEAYKLLGVALVGLCWRPSLDGARRGLALGMLVGLGFSMIEDSRLLIVLAGGPADPLPALQSAAEWYGFRIVAAGLFIHVGLTGVTGMALGMAFARGDRSRWLLVGTAYLAAAAVHALFNSELFGAPPLPWQNADLPLVIGHALLRNAPDALALAALFALRRGSR